MVTEKLNVMQSMIRNRELCLKKLADVQVRPVQLVAPRPEPDQTSQRCKSPLFSPKHGTTRSEADLCAVSPVLILLQQLFFKVETHSAGSVIKSMKIIL